MAFIIDESLCAIDGVNRPISRPFFTIYSCISKCFHFTMIKMTTTVENGFGSLQMVRTSLGDNFAPISLISRRGMALPPVVMRFEQAVHAAAAALKLS